MTPLLGTESSRPRDNYLPTLDGWRAIAIVAVLIAHGVADGRAGLGAKGVDIFFGISGFLICTRLLDEWRRRGRVSLLGFYIRRIFRILPPYYAYLAVLSLMVAAGIVRIRPQELLSCVFFYRNYLIPSSGDSWYTGHFWSLAVEEHFYLMLPGLLVLLGPARARFPIVGLACAIGIWRVVDFHYHIYDRWFPPANFYLRTDIRLDGLLWGCAAAFLFAHPTFRERLTRALSLPVWSIVLAVYLICLLKPFPLATICEPILISVLLIGTVLRPENVVGRALEAAPLRRIGQLSYSLYLWQQMFLVRDLEHRLPALGKWQTFPYNLIALTACACLSFYVLERPMIRRGKALSKEFTTQARASRANKLPVS